MIPHRIPYRTIFVLTVVVVAVFVALSWRASCQRAGRLQDEATIADARSSSAVAAIEIIGENTAANTATHAQVKEAQNAIRQADPNMRDAVARRELCKLQGHSPC